MGIFDRLRRLIKANVNSAIDKAEDPEKLLNQLLIEMNEQLVEAKRAVASAIADEKRLERQIQEHLVQSQDWERRAVLALREAEKNPARALEFEDMAKQALMRKKEYDEIAGKLQEQLGAQHQAVEKLKYSLKDLQRRIEEKQRQKTLLVARAKRAEAHKKIQEQVAGMSDNSSFDAFEKMAQKVDRIEAEADALSEIEASTSGSSLEQEFAKLERNSSGDLLLENFKQEQKKKAAALEAGKSASSQRIEAPRSAAPSTDVDIMMEDLKKKLHGA